MNTETFRIAVSGLTVEVVRKDIKNLHLGVYPPNGRVRVAAPTGMSLNAIRLAVIGKLGWIKKQRVKFDTQPRQSEREMVDGETHYVSGRRYRLRVIEEKAPARASIRGPATLELRVRPGTTTEQRERILQEWYRQQLKAELPPLIAKWQRKLGVAPREWGIRRMKTKWGTCNPSARRIWINLELAKKPPRCLEFIVVHELVHLIERKHTPRFAEIMHAHLPRWRSCREELNRAPLAHEQWGY